MEQRSLEQGDLQQAELINENVNEFREKAILLKSLTIIEENERAVRVTSSTS